MEREARFKVIEKRDPQRYKAMVEQAQRNAEQQISLYQQLSRVALPAEQRGNGQDQEERPS